MSWYYGRFPKYVPVAERRAKARKQMDKLRKQGQTIDPVEIEGRAIARSFWGKGWCEHLESFSDFDNRLPRGRGYARNGSVCHLAVRPGEIEAFVNGSSLYNIRIRIAKLKPKAWQAIKQRCAGQIGSMLELLKGKLSGQVMAVVTDREAGLFPKPDEIELDCSCPDWATMCKHVAAALYGVGSRLDDRPELLFTLRGVDPQELIAGELTLPGGAGTDAQTLADDRISDVFGIDLDDAPQPATRPVNTRAGSKAKSGSVTKPKPAGRPASTAPTDASQRTPPARRKRGGKGDSASAPQRADAGQKPALRPTGKSVARLRRQAGLSKAQFARTLGVSAASVSRWESTAGRLDLRARPLEALAKLKHRIART